MTYLPDSNWIKKPYLDGKENHRSTTPSFFKQGAINFPKISNSFFLILILLACSQLGFGQKAGDYGTIAAGAWSNTFSSRAIWGKWDGTSFAAISASDALPSSSTVVYIRGSFTITIGATCSAKTLTVEYGSTIMFGDAKSLLVGNPTYKDGIFKNYGNITVTSGSNFTINGNAIFGNSTSGSITLNPGSQLEVTGSADFARINCMTISSSGDYSSNLKYGSATSVNDAVSVERFMSNSDKWHLYSDPVVGQTIHDFIFANKEIPDLVSGGSSIGVGMRDYNTEGDIWSPPFVYVDNTPNTPDGSMVQGKGYSIRTIMEGAGSDGGTIFATGIPDLDNKVTVDLTTGGNNWNCIGNPFTCAISVFDFSNLNTNALELDPSYVAVYLWDSQNLFGKSSASYVLSNLSSITSTSVQMGQGFFVKKKSTGGTGTGNVTFNSSMQLLDPTQFFKSAKPEWPTIYLVIDNHSLKSNTQIKFIPNTTKGLDPGYDGGLLTAYPEFSIYSRLLEDNGVNFMLQCLPDQNYDQYVIPIGIDCKVAGDITFTASSVNLQPGCQVLLEDRLTKRFTRLDLKDANYTATVSADTKGIGRFFLHTSDVISGDQPIEKEQFKVNKIGNTLYITGEVSGNANFFVYSITGQQLANFKAQNQVQNQFDASGLPAGVYILTVDDKSQKKSIKFVIEN